MSGPSIPLDSPIASLLQDAQPLSPQTSEGVLKENKNDAGNLPSNHYKERLSLFRFKLRQMCLPIVRKETDLLARLQARVRTPGRDLYFAWTANLASHTFYVLMLPLPLWFGASTLARDLIFVLGMGIYVTGFFKDFLCLPRPRSPPLHRITMLSYTAHEYGWPSSHSANATAVTLVLLATFYDQRSSFSYLQFVTLIGLLALYYLSLILGRLYCGMHGFFDILTGMSIGTGVFLFRYFYGVAYDQFLFYSSRNSSWLGIFATFFVIIAGHMYLIHIYPEPVDDCPCLTIPWLLWVFSSESILLTTCVVVIGIVLVVIWKSILKPVLFSILPPLYKLIGVNLPRVNYISTAHSKTASHQIRRQSLSNMKNEPMIPIEDILKSARQEVDVVGPEDDIDAYELLDYQLKHPEDKSVSVKISGVFRPRYDVEIVGRTIVYAGISITSVWGFAFATQAMGLT
ncbi:CIC11C00000005769 [Sungouiella intermedia]|uniref:CIC11C00000005769 n=1 Tax=Sungouiella intermedia TaxID=45354 RepID=A0A1L0C3T9_9ASCO|nr:CIC11C00000005769 [[Candida] intermedia]